MLAEHNPPGPVAAGWQGEVQKAPTSSAVLSDGDLVNFANIARDCGVSGHTVKGHFGILEDTLLGRWLPAYTRRPKRRVVTAPKFYFSDVGVVNHLARLGRLQPGGELFGRACQMDVAIEAKASARITADHLKGLRHLRADHPQARRVVVCLEPKRRVTEDGIEILPTAVFTAQLGRLLAA